MIKVKVCFDSIYDYADFFFMNLPALPRVGDIVMIDTDSKSFKEFINNLGERSIYEDPIDHCDYQNVNGILYFDNDEYIMITLE